MTREVIVEAESVAQARVIGASRLSASPSEVEIEVLRERDRAGGNYQVKVMVETVGESDDLNLAYEYETDEKYKELFADPEHGEEALRELTMQELDQLLEGAGSIDREMVSTVRDLTVGLDSRLSQEIGDMHLKKVLGRVGGDRLDGYIEVRRDLSKTEATLLFHPPREGGRALELEDVIRKISSLGAVVPPADELRRIVKRVGKPRPGHITLDIKFRPGRFELHLSRDEMILTATIFPPGKAGENVAFKDVMEAVNEMGVAAPVDVNVLKRSLAEITARSKEAIEVVIARGKAPVDGSDAIVKWKLPVVQSASGDWEIKDGASPVIVRAGQEILTKIPASPGESGSTVLGHPVPPAAGSDVSVRMGAGISKDKDREVWRAAVDGRFRIEKDSFVVEAYQPGSIDVKLSQDLMSAEIVVMPPIGEASPVQREDVMQALARSGVTFGIDEEKVDDVVDLVEKTRALVVTTVARGEKVTPGIPAEVEYPVEDMIALLHEDDSLNPRDRTAVRAIKEGDVAAILYPPEQGRAGCNVKGNIIEPKRLPEIELQAGEGIVRENGKFIAAKNGHLAVSDGVLRIEKVYHVRGDLNMSVGNIRHDGAVIIDGAVEDKYVIEAEGEVVIRDNLGASTVSSRSNVRIGNGFVGRHSGRIDAGGDVEARFVENATIFATGDVTIRDYVLQSHIETEGRLIVEGDGGIVGGTIVARAGIVARQSGSKAVVATTLRTGESPVLREKIRKAEGYFREIENEIAKVLGIEHRLNKAYPDIGMMPPEKTRIYHQLLRAKLGLKVQMKEVGIRRVTLLKESQTIEPGEIEVYGRIHPGTFVVIGSVEYNVTKPLENVRFRADRARSEVLVEKM